MSWPPRSCARQPAMIPAARTGESTVDARLPRSGTNASAIMITTKTMTIAIQTHGAAAKSRQPSVHQVSPLPAATVAGTPPLGGGAGTRTERVGARH